MRKTSNNKKMPMLNEKMMLNRIHSVQTLYEPLTINVIKQEIKAGLPEKNLSIDAIMQLIFAGRELKLLAEIKSKYRYDRRSKWYTTA